jgi:uncharacterized repeat protein (TIGR03837 family)
VAQTRIVHFRIIRRVTPVVPRPSSPPPSPPARPALLFDLFCKVIDNFGDIGVCWRLAADLAGRGHRVRLWCDDPSALQWLAPQGAAGVEWIPWRAPVPVLPPGDVVIEAFACDPPAAFVQAMAGALNPPVWINLEYLSAQTWVERCHRLPSPQFHGPGAGLVKWFFHPGFTAATGGLIREPGLFEAQARFDRDGWLRTWGLHLRAGERLVVLFCYDNPALPQMLRFLGQQPTLLALTPGPAQQQVHGLALPALLRTHDLPWLSQSDFDRLLWSADLNLVRGEDSLVRAIWAGRPFLWQLYPQQDGAHFAKSDAFLDLFLSWPSADGPRSEDTSALRALWNLWNGRGQVPGALLEGGAPELAAWTARAQRFRQALAAQTDLVTQLLQLVAQRSPGLAPETGPAGATEAPPGKASTQPLAG